MRKNFSYHLLIFFLPILINCSNTGSLSRSNPRESEAILESSTESKGDYLLQIGDVIDVKFYYDSKLNETVTVRPDGKISLQLIGELAAADQTPSELNKVIVNKYSKFLKNPEATVIIKEFGGQKVYVGGEVITAGVIVLKGNTTVLQATVNAGGFKETAHQGSIIVISRGKEDTSVTRKIDLRDIISGKAEGKDIYVKPFDVIYVHKTLIAEVDKFVEQYIKKVILVDLTAGFNYGIFKNRLVPVP